MQIWEIILLWVSFKLPNPLSWFPFLPVYRSPGGTSLIALTGTISHWPRRFPPTTSIQRHTPIGGSGLGVGGRTDHARVLALCHTFRGSVTLVMQAAAGTAAAQRQSLGQRCFSFWFLVTDCRVLNRMEPSWERTENLSIGTDCYRSQEILDYRTVRPQVF